jgi:hypothetical protein
MHLSIFPAGIYPAGERQKGGNRRVSAVMLKTNDQNREERNGRDAHHRWGDIRISTTIYILCSSETIEEQCLRENRA